MFQTKIMMLLILIGLMVYSDKIHSMDASGMQIKDQKEEVIEQQQKNEPELNLSDSIPIRDLTAYFESGYQSLVDYLGLGYGIFAKILISFASIAFILLFFFFIRVSINGGKRKLSCWSSKLKLSDSRINFYGKSLSVFLKSVLFFILIIALSATWGFNVESVIENTSFQSIVANIVSVYFILMFGIIAVDVLNGLLEAIFMRWRGVTSKSRIDTLLPIAKNTVYVVFGIMFSLVVLSELGINVMPLLAGAGVLGFAIGFGAQTLIKDLLTGFIIIFEDLIQVGDVVRLSDRVGQIEKITIRKVQLRDLSGVVFTVPFSEISIVENLTKDYSYAMFNIGVAYREKVDHVIELINQTGEKLLQNPDYADVILEPIEILGLDKFADSAVVLKARIKTQPMEQWGVMREFNRQLKILFDQENIEIPFPHQTIYFGQDKNGEAPPLHITRPNTTRQCNEEERNHNERGKNRHSRGKDERDEVQPGEDAQESNPSELEEDQRKTDRSKIKSYDGEETYD